MHVVYIILSEILKVLLGSLNTGDGLNHLDSVLSVVEKRGEDLVVDARVSEKREKDLVVSARVSQKRGQDFILSALVNQKL